MSCAPFVSSPIEVVRKMLELANVGPDDVVYDLGCGDGRILFTAVKEFHVKKAVGYEIREDLYKSTLNEVQKQDLVERVHIINEDLFKANISEATVITLYLTTTANERLKQKLIDEARYGSRVVSHDFSIGGWYASKKESFSNHVIYLYTLPYAYKM
ncbi:MAG: rRNA adenine N-6-methyltransferase family protein [Candidatus Bathyarchaeia archaeon]